MEVSPIAKLLYHPDCTDLKRTGRTLKKLNSMAEQGKWPFKFREPGVCLSYWLDQIGLSSTEEKARILLANTITDVGVDSIKLVQLFFEGIVSENSCYHLFDPMYHNQQPEIIAAANSTVDVFDEKTEIPEAESDLLGPAEEVSKWLEGIRYKYAENVGSFWSGTFASISQRFGGNVLDLFNGFDSAEKLLAELLSSRPAITIVDKDGKTHTSKPSVYPGLGKKTARVAINRAVNVGLCKPHKLSAVGIPVDSHALAFAVGHRLVHLDEPVPPDGLANSITALFADACVAYNINPASTYENFWLWCSQMCRRLKCNSCPFYENGSGKIRPVSCYGRVSTSGYYAYSNRRIDPKNVVKPDKQLSLGYVSEILEPEISHELPPHNPNQTLILPFAVE